KMLTASDLARLCRICLRQLRDPQYPNPRLIQLLKKFLDIDVLQQPHGFPTQICNLCHNAMTLLEELGQVARDTSEKLAGYLTGTKDSDPISNTVEMSAERVKEEPLDQGQDDSQDMEMHQELEKLEMLVEQQENAEQEQQHLEEVQAAQQKEKEQDLEQRENQNHTTSPNKKRTSLACDQCGKQVYKLPYLEAHIRSVHQGYTKPFLCRSCDKCFTRYEQLRSHMRNAHPHPHPQMHQQQLQELRELMCELCNRQYSTKNALGEHLKRHAQRKEHVCEHCGVAKVTRTELLTHLRTHNPTWERFKCQQCPQLFRHKSAISRHVRVVHEGQRRFQCGHCEKRFGTHASQLRHERLHAAEGEVEEEEESEEEAGEGSDPKLWPESFACSHCQKPCVTRQNLEMHLRRHRRGRKAQEWLRDQEQEQESEETEEEKQQCQEEQRKKKDQ
ncbi:hypothetical protein KR032_006758, partial [Drosophila birchii]